MVVSSSNISFDANWKLFLTTTTPAVHDIVLDVEGVFVVVHVAVHRHLHEEEPDVRGDDLGQPGDHPGKKRNKYGKYLSGDDLGNNPGNGEWWLMVLETDGWWSWKQRNKPGVWSSWKMGNNLLRRRLLWPHSPQQKTRPKKIPPLTLQDIKMNLPHLFDPAKRRIWTTWGYQGSRIHMITRNGQWIS